VGNTTSVKRFELQTKLQQEFQLAQRDGRPLAMASAAKVFVCWLVPSLNDVGSH